MKVVILGNYPTFPFAGKLDVPGGGLKTSTWLIYFSKYLALHPGIEVHVVTEDQQIRKDTYFVEEGIHFHFIKCPPNYRAATLFVGDIVRINKVVNKIKPDIINAHHTDEYALSALFSGFPYVITVHGIYSRFVPKGKIISRAKVVSYIEKFILRKARYLIASSPFVYEAVGKMTRAKFYDVENCLDEEYFQQRKNYANNYSLIYIGYVIKDKGVDYLVEAVNLLKREFPQILLRIVGVFSPVEQEFAERLKHYIADHDLSRNVVFEGFVVSEKKIELINQSTVLVHPSRLETFCLSVAEAMATGTPVVATRVGGLPNTVGGDKNAMLVEYGSAEQLCTAIRLLLVDDVKRRKIGENGKAEAARRFHPSVVIPQLVNVFNDIIKCEK